MQTTLCVDRTDWLLGFLLLGRSQRSKPKSRCRDRKADFVMVQHRLTDMEAFLNRQIT